jgi:hypothetical protein
MSEVRIKYGKDQFGRLIHINDAEHRSFLYVCPECDTPLLVREGDIRTKHFAHSSDDAERTCSLRSLVQYEQWEKSIKISPVEKDEKDKRLRLIICKHPYLNKYELFASLPTARPEDFLLYNETERDEIINSIIVEGNCIRDSYTPPEYFHPREPEVLIPLVINNEDFKVSIKASQNIPSITGIWTSSKINPSDIFLGDEFRAERIYDYSRLSDGQYIYIIKKGPLNKIPQGCQIFDLEDFKIIISEVNEKNLQVLQQLFPEQELTIDNNSFDVDVILPPDIKPNCNEPIIGSSRSIALVSIIPPSNLDPSFEIISIPFNEKEQKFVDNTGQGNARFFAINFPSQGSKRVSIFWSGRHKYLHLHSSEKEINEIYQKKPKQTIKIGVKAVSNSNNELILPYSSNPKPYLIIEKKDRKNNELGFEFIAPENLLIDIYGFSIDSKIIGPYQKIFVKDAPQIIKDWFQFNLQYLHLSYGALGKIIIEYSLDKIIEINITNEEIETRLKNLPSLPKKANKKIIRLILGLKEGSVLPSGYRKKIRRILIKIKREKNSRGRKT